MITEAKEAHFLVLFVLKVYANELADLKERLMKEVQSCGKNDRFFPQNIFSFDADYCHAVSFNGSH